MPNSEGTLYTGLAFIVTLSNGAWGQTQTLSASDGAEGDGFGTSVSLSGGIAVVGAPQAGGGKAYVFVQNGANWVQQQILIGNDTANGDNFGYAVGVSGTTIVIGAFLAKIGSNYAQGAVYVFTQSGSTWAQMQKLVASDGVADNEFGTSVSISGSTLVIGAPQCTIGSNSDQGAAYVFTQSGTAWAQLQKLVATNGAPFDLFGYSVSVSGSTIVVGADGATVNGNFEQGTVYIFTQSGSTWNQLQQLSETNGSAGDYFGYSVSTSGSTIVIGTPGYSAQSVGMAYVYAQSGSSFVLQQTLVPSDGMYGDNFGRAVGVSGNAIMIGSPYHTVNGRIQKGAVYPYLFSSSSSVWSQGSFVSTTLNSPGVNYFGASVSISNNLLVVGAPSTQVIVNGLPNSDQGEAYIFAQSGGTWALQQKLLASNGTAGDRFGYSVSISGNIIIIGAPYSTVTNTEQGSAYVFIQNGATWIQQQQLVANDANNYDYFGLSVSIAGTTIVIGVPNANINGNYYQGSAYVFTQSGTSFVQQQKLVASDGNQYYSFGNSVSISGNILVIGSPGSNISGNANQGAVYVFIQSGSTWTLQQKLIASDGKAGDSFGNAVSISGTTIAIGAYYATINGELYQGAVYVFTQNGSNWLQQQKLVISNASDYFQFGYSVSICGDYLLASAYYHYIPPDKKRSSMTTDKSSIYLFMQNGGMWSNVFELNSSLPLIGYSVSVSCQNTFAFGAPDVGSPAEEFAYVYGLQSSQITGSSASNRQSAQGPPLKYLLVIILPIAAFLCCCLLILIAYLVRRRRKEKESQNLEMK